MVGLESFPDTRWRFNRVFAPYARVLVIHIPKELTFDGMHMTSAGAAELARALWNARPEGDRR
jgi:lysophospholipase L1-like esterase